MVKILFYIDDLCVCVCVCVCVRERERERARESLGMILADHL
jgi:hypothetical protein